MFSIIQKIKFPLANNFGHRKHMGEKVWLIYLFQQLYKPYCELKWVKVKISTLFIFKFFSNGDS